ncbi:MAG: metal-dependent transcriptional regulator [Acidimicrobiia bacterium]|nr:metal-dependent transcriptional regulator [Acidimicrobiia bacterium]
MTDPLLALAVFAVLAAGLALLLWPRRGVVARVSQLLRLDERVRLEDALKHVFTCQRNGDTCSLESLAGRLEVSTARAAALLSRLTDLGLVRPGAGGPVLTGEGSQTALRLVRTHRLWERYLADRTGVPAGEWHDRAEQMEHVLSDAQTDALASKLGHPRWDPHGDPIPTSSGDIPPPRGASLLAAPAGGTVEVVHLEDEPREIYDALVREGLALGSRLSQVDVTDRAVGFRLAGRERAISQVLARNVTVRRLSDSEADASARPTLLDVRLGETARVEGIAATCHGSQRRRLLDLGVVKGTEISAELQSASGDPVAYRIRGALIALRREQAAAIYVERAGESPSRVVA